jgi:hypothetical protein
MVATCFSVLSTGGLAAAAAWNFLVPNNVIPAKTRRTVVQTVCFIASSSRTFVPQLLFLG